MHPSGESSEGQRSWYRRYHFDSEVRQKRNVQMEVTSPDDSFNTNTTVDIEPVDSGAGLLDREIAQNGSTVGEKPK
ncbi:uncharacterized protein APUU_20081S [Aspergillus puulaauensis]|uniref:Uncharacterized protein n=1 Tax=Aspergillus puulaauensis TaxID=1220207 RepID=A0A7R7XFD4_9EURO|nr:uncharacterized protein APUU_20081S [Aspergillus puulaauensis]BCS19649.1 hypothetical protein APUU_20081S [Aspergillus puulaauensis]